MRKALINLLIIFVFFGIGMYVVFGEVTTAIMFSLLYGGILTAVLTLLYNTSSKSIQMQSSNVNRGEANGSSRFIC
ncbi:hypothetical protein LQ50_02710 [Halalkalibacter okhensis]|uniref:Uncharacterized protein n=1 Tax=Halalkalibacter okhensis TaxID=333138 RepID=A0A0B0INH0_9BACI|nr:hypothetical protein LQ50_02710 [Halalkalibacter okhensis]